MANVCACGCGELLPENSTRQYKRGHKQRVSVPGTDTVTVTIDEPFEEAADYTLEQAANEIPPDPEPAEEPEFRPQPAIRITAAVRKDVKGKLAFLLAMTGQGIAMPDPICGNALLDNAPNIADKLTPLVCQSPDLVRWFTKSGKYMLWLDLVMAFWPVLQIVFAHHIAKTVQLQPMPSSNGQAAPSPDIYVVQ